MGRSISLCVSENVFEAEPSACVPDSLDEDEYKVSYINYYLINEMFPWTYRG